MIVNKPVVAAIDGRLHRELVGPHSAEIHQRILAEFTVFGVPVPQGSMRAFVPRGWKRAILTSDNKKLKPWRQEIAGSAQAVIRFPIERERAVAIQCRFYFPRAKSLKKAISYKTTRPDIDKLARALLDGLTGIAFEDDAQVIDLRCTKSFDIVPRAEIIITEKEP